MIKGWSGGVVEQEQKVSRFLGVKVSRGND
jgi:hypothetical protein